jgi:hypothetical protein
MSKHNLPLRAANLIHALDGLDAAKASGEVAAVAAAQAAHDAAKAAFDAAKAAVVEAVGLDNVCWYGQYARPQQAAFYRGGDRRRARRIERLVAAAGIPPTVLKDAHYMGFTAAR